MSMVTKIGVVASAVLLAVLASPSASLAAKKTRAYDPNWRINQPIPNMSAQFYRSGSQKSQKHKTHSKANN